MNFVERDIGVTSGAAVSGIKEQPQANKWPISYGSIEFISVVADVTVIFLLTKQSLTVGFLTVLGKAP